MKRFLGITTAAAVLAACTACGVEPHVLVVPETGGSQTQIKVDEPYTAAVILCSDSREGGAITLTGVAFPGMTGPDEPPVVEVTWAGSSEAEPAVGASGPVVSCRDDEADNDAFLSVTFPSGDEPVLVKEISVSFEQDGKEITRTEDFVLELCPPRQCSDM